MLRNRFVSGAAPFVSASLLVLFLLASPAEAREDVLEGTVVDAVSERAIEGAEVRLPATGWTDRTDALGAYGLPSPSSGPLVLEIEADGYHPARLVMQEAGATGLVNLLPLEIAREELAVRGERPRFGVPWHRREAMATPGGEVYLPPAAGPLFASTPADIPETIRVGRRFASTCSGNPVQRIDEMPFEDYVAGVLPPEIGVFKSVPDGPESARAVFEAFAVLARSYGLWFYLTRGADAEWHIDDTACEQRYEEQRDPWITEVVMSTAGQVLVKANDPGVIDKYEYAASCGRHGTRPAYQSEIIPDDTPGRGCTTGGWCGHDDCAAHETNPNVSPDNRCLVRGVCQWGSLERSKGGHSKLDILGHYQPHLVLIDLGSDPSGNLVGLVREEDIETGEPVEGAAVTLQTGASTVTDSSGAYRFDGLAHGVYEITADAEGYLSASREREINGPGDHWASLALAVDDENEDEPDEPSNGGEPDEPSDPGVDPENGEAGGGAGLPRPPGTAEGGCGCLAGSGKGAVAPLLLLLPAFLARRALRQERAKGSP